MDNLAHPPLAIRLRNGDQLLANDRQLRLNGTPLPIDRITLSCLSPHHRRQRQGYALRTWDRHGGCSWYAPQWLFNGDDFQRLCQRLEANHWPLEYPVSRAWHWPVRLSLLLASLVLLMLWLGD